MNPVVDPKKRTDPVHSTLLSVSASELPLHARIMVRSTRDESETNIWQIDPARDPALSSSQLTAMQCKIMKALWPTQEASLRKRATNEHNLPYAPHYAGDANNTEPLTSLP